MYTWLLKNITLYEKKVVELLFIESGSITISEAQIVFFIFFYCFSQQLYQNYMRYKEWKIELQKYRHRNISGKWYHFFGCISSFMCNFSLNSFPRFQSNLLFEWPCAFTLVETFRLVETLHCTSRDNTNINVLTVCNRAFFCWIKGGFHQKDCFHLFFF